MGRVLFWDGNGFLMNGEVWARSRDRIVAVTEEGGLKRPRLALSLSFFP
jgi:hypothetical protein